MHAAHRLLGTHAKDAKLVGVSVPAKAAEWILPGVESNKLSYYRVYGSRLTYTVDGKTKSFGLFSLISWRGQWYVVHFGPNPRRSRSAPSTSPADSHRFNHHLTPIRPRRPAFNRRRGGSCDSFEECDHRRCCRAGRGANGACSASWLPASW